MIKEREHTLAAPADPISEAAPARPKKTTGEHHYDVFQFLTGKVFIVIVSAVMAYAARYGPDHYGKVPNILKTWQNGVETFFCDWLKLGRGGDNFKSRLGYAAAGTTLTMWGGNLFSPFLKALENREEQVANYFNKKFGKPGEVEAAHERLKDKPKQNWMDILKGRAAGWVIVFSTMVGFDNLLGKNKEGVYRFDQYENWFGGKMTQWFGGTEGKALVAQNAEKALSEHKMHRVGKIIALDFFATTAAILIWNVVSRHSAKKREIRHERKEGHRLIAHSARQMDSPEEAVALADQALPKVDERTAPREETPRDKIVAATIDGHQKLANAELAIS